MELSRTYGIFWELRKRIPVPILRQDSLKWDLQEKIAFLLLPADKSALVLCIHVNTTDVFNWSPAGGYESESSFSEFKEVWSWSSVTSVGNTYINKKYLH